MMKSFKGRLDKKTLAGVFIFLAGVFLFNGEKRKTEAMVL